MFLSGMMGSGLSVRNIEKSPHEEAGYQGEGPYSAHYTVCRYKITISEDNADAVHPIRIHLNIRSEISYVPNRNEFRLGK